MQLDISLAFSSEYIQFLSSVTSKQEFVINDYISSRPKKGVNDHDE